MRAHGQIVLASASPRRKDLLERLGLKLVVIPSQIDERTQAREPAQVALKVAQRKVEAVRTGLEADFTGWIVGADTMVVLDGEILGKPKDDAEAHQMLGRLSGRTHEVFTGYCVVTGGGAREEGVVRTEVTFRSLRDEEIAWYVGTGEPSDKAGAYGIQDKGLFLIDALTGSLSNVIGLPLAEVIEALRTLGALSRD